MAYTLFSEISLPFIDSILTTYSIMGHQTLLKINEQDCCMVTVLLFAGLTKTDTLFLCGFQVNLL